MDGQISQQISVLSLKLLELINVIRMTKSINLL